MRRLIRGSDGRRSRRAPTRLRRCRLRRGVADDDVRPHVGRNMSGRRSAIGQRTTGHPAMPTGARPQADRGSIRLDQDGSELAPNQAARPCQGRPVAKVDWAFTFAAAACDLVRDAGRMNLMPVNLTLVIVVRSGFSDFGRGYTGAFGIGGIVLIAFIVCHLLVSSERFQLPTGNREDHRDAKPQAATLPESK